MIGLEDEFSRAVCNIDSGRLVALRAAGVPDAAFAAHLVGMAQIETHAGGLFDIVDDGDLAVHRESCRDRHPQARGMSDTDTGALTSGEATELHGLENEMSDPNGKVFDGHWRDHYNHNTAKQERARDLVAKRDGIFKTPQDAQEYEEAMNGPSAFEGFSAREVDRANEASESLVRELGDTRDIDRGFENLSKPAQEQAAKMWANPHLAASYMRQMPSSIREEFESYLANLPDRDRAAVRRRVGLS